MTDNPGAVSQESLQQIRSNADVIVASCNYTCGFEFGFNEQSVEWLDGFIEKLRSGPFSEEQREAMQTNIGCYLGEAIIRAHGGKWSLNEQGWHVLFPIGTRAFPFSKVRKRFLDGEFDSITGFYRVAGEFAKPESERQFTPAISFAGPETSGPSTAFTQFKAILTDSHFLVPLIVLCIGLALLITLH